MATFAITTTQNIDELSGKTGGDVYNINGGTLNVDQDSRVGLNQNTSASWSTATISATLGGTINFNGANVRLIPYGSGTGNVPAWNTVISQGSASGKLIGVYSSLTAASTATGSAMPTSGFIKIKQWNGTAFSTGALTGIGASATGSDVVGWLDIVGDEGGTINANRLGVVNITGSWYLLGTTSGASNQTLQIPNSGLTRYAAGVYIEKTAGSNDYEFYPNAGTATTIGTEADRGKVVWIDANGLVRIGNNGSATMGFTPASGLKVVVPNIFFENCTTAARTSNVIPNATLASRFDFTTSGGGVVNADKCNFAWYPSFSQAFSVSLTNCCSVDAILLSECASSISWSKVGVGNKPTTALVTAALTVTYSFAGGTFTDCVWTMVSQGSSGNHIVVLTDIDGFTFTRNVFRANTIRGNATTYSINATRAKNCVFTDAHIVQGSMAFTTCDNISATGTKYIDAVSGTTVTTYAVYVWRVSSASSNCVFSGLTFPVTNTHPYTGLILIDASGCANIKLRSIGARASPLNLGSTNACGVIIVFTANSAAKDIRVQRVYTSNTRTGIFSGDNSNTQVLLENTFGDYLDSADVGSALNMYRKGIGGTLALTAQTSVYGTHWFDCFTSTTAGRIGLLMNEPTNLTSSQVSLSGGAAFTSAGGLYMPTVNQTAVFETPYYIIGHTGFQNASPVMAGGTIGNYTLSYQIDKNNGSGYSAWKTMSAANLSGETGIDAEKGFKMMWRIVTSTTNAAAITSLYILTNSSTAAQDFQYPLDLASITLNNVVSGSRYEIYNLTTLTLLAVGQAASSTVSVSAVASNGDSLRIRVRKSSSSTKYLPFETQAVVSNNASSTWVSQVQDVFA